MKIVRENISNRNLVLIRGISGSGKTTFAELVCNTVFSADQYFEDENGNYNFDASKLNDAHEQCQKNTEEAMSKGLSKICVANTFTQEWEMAPYFKLAKKYGYRTFSIVVENRHNNVNIHDVPTETLNKQKSRFDIKL